MGSLSTGGLCPEEEEREVFGHMCQHNHQLAYFFICHLIEIFEGCPSLFLIGPYSTKMLYFTIEMRKLGAHFYGQQSQQTRGRSGIEMTIRSLSHQVAEEYS